MAARSLTIAPAARHVVAVAAAAALLAAGAGSALAVSSSSSSATATSARSGAQVKLRQTALGRVLVDGRGRTLYLFEADKRTRSVCYGACAAAWPPLLTSARPRAGAGVRTALLGTTKRRGGTLQVTYGGHPLYVFYRDRRAGQTAGQAIDGFGGEWYVLDARGRRIERHGGSAGAAATTTTTTTTTTPTTTDGGGYGGGYGYGG